MSETRERNAELNILDVNDFNEAVDEEEYSYNESHGSTHPLELKESIDMRKLFSNGAVFEIAEQDKKVDPVHEVYDRNLQYEQLLANLSLGTDYCGQEDNPLGSDEDDLEPFEKLSRTMEDISGDGGVLKKLVYPGIGGDIPEKAKVTFHYSAFLEYADEPFDSTFFQNKPKKCTLSEADVVLGLRIGLMTMRNKEKAKFLVQPNYAFGSLGCPPRIPGNAHILFDVTIISVVDYSAADEYDALGEDERMLAPFSKKYEASVTYHRKGNEYCKGENYVKARECYTKALRLLEHNCSARNEEEAKKHMEMICRMYSNLAQVNINLKDPARACSNCQNAFEIDTQLSDDIKAKLFFRYAKAKMMLDSYSAARKYLMKARQLKPNSSDIDTLLKTLITKEAKAEELEKFMCQRMFRNQGHNSATSDSSIAAAAESKGNEGDAEIQREDEAPVLPKVRPEFEEVVKDQLLNFLANDSVKETTLPPNLSTEELAYVFAAAKAAKVNMKKYHLGKQVILKFVK